MFDAHRIGLCAVFLSLMAGSIGCGGDEAATPTPSAAPGTPNPSPTAADSTPSEAPSLTPVATPTPVTSPTPDATPSPSISPVGADTPTPDPSPTTTPSPTPEPDADGDGVSPRQGDCNDADPAIGPWVDEICDDIDNDCDGLIDDGDDSLVATSYHPDFDKDDFGNPSIGGPFCEVPLGYIPNDKDCDDANPGINPNAQEVCDEGDTDEDCDGYVDDFDGSVDPESWRFLYPDQDYDGFGDWGAIPILACDSPSGPIPFLVDGTDCDDADPRTFPFSDELCDAIDRDCDGIVDEGFDFDGDGTSDCVDNDGDGATEALGDCDDGDALNFPFANDSIDTDWDGWGDTCDNCPRVYNPDQVDSDGDGLGDRCHIPEALPWGEPEAVLTLGAGHDGVNDRDPHLTPEGSCVLFASDRSGGLGGYDIWEACREDLDGDFGEPTPLGAPVNSVGPETQPALSIDGRSLYFVRGEGSAAELYVAQRAKRGDPFGLPHSLGDLNQGGIFDGAPCPSADGQALYFISERTGRGDVYRATPNLDTGRFSEPQLISNLSSSFAEAGLALRSDGVWGLTASALDGGADVDLYVITRGGEGEAWGAPVPLEGGASDAFDGGGTIRGDGEEILFYSSRSGPFGIYRMRRGP